MIFFVRLGLSALIWLSSGVLGTLFFMLLYMQESLAGDVNEYTGADNAPVFIGFSVVVLIVALLFSLPMIFLHLGALYIITRMADRIARFIFMILFTMMVCAGIFYLYHKLLVGFDSGTHFHSLHLPYLTASVISAVLIPLKILLRKKASTGNAAATGPGKEQGK
jgi:hypothetical protein